MIITFIYKEKGDWIENQYYNIRFDKDKIDRVIPDILHDFDGVSWNQTEHKKQEMISLDKYILKLRYRCKSRADDMPIFQFDTLKFERAEKLKKLLCHF